MTNLTVSPIENKVEILGDGNEIVVTAPGPQGPPGEQGIQGPKGETGDVAALVFVFEQATASATWTIEHNKGYYLQATVVDSGGTQVEGNVTFSDANTVVIEFAAPFSGTAYLS